MKTKNKKTQNLISALAMIIILTIGSITVFSQKQLTERSGRSGNDLVGVWEAVGVPAHNDCETGEPMGELINVTYTFNQGGTMYAEDTLSIDRYRTTGSGIWKRTSGRNYTYRFFHYGFDSNGNFLFTVKGWSNLTLSKDGNSLTEQGAFDLVAPSGTVIYSGCFNGSSNRVTF
jgi:hypothetical protein